MTETGLVLTRGTSVRALATSLIDWVKGLDAGVFEAPLILTPGSGMQRWLSQQVARAGGPEGICAGVEFAPLARLVPLLSGEDDVDDPWGPERLVWHILDLVAAGTPGLDVLAHHLDATDQRQANAARIAGLLARYAALRPALLESWSAADDPASLGLGEHTWQPVLWRALRAVVPGPDPLERRSTLLRALEAGERGPTGPGVAVFCPTRLTVPEADLIAALAAGRRVHTWLHMAGPEASEHPLATRLGSRGSETAALLTARAASATDLPEPTRPGTLLGTLQRQLASGEPARAEASVDGSVSVHASHGPDRQAEVLREVLAGFFADDPTLQPRDVVVACPDPAALAPHLNAVFRGRSGAEQHPGFTFRVKVIDGGGADSNQLLTLVREVSLLTATRATAGQLVGLASHPFVARRFGLDEDDLERLGDLIAKAAVRWGLDDSHRRSFGLELVRQGTWQVGVQRLLLGEALSDDDLPSAGVISPVDDVESSDVELVGALAELVSRVWRLAQGPDVPTPAGWVAHLRRIVELLADVPFDDAWQLAEFWSVVDQLERRAGGSEVALGAADALALVTAEFERRQSRRGFGDGSLIVCGLSGLAQVPHRAVCLVGLDERSFPRRGLADGDNLLAFDPRPGDPDPGRDDRQLILDAVGAAEERLAIVYQGRSSHTREHRPPPPGVADVIETLAATAGVGASDITIDEPLQPFSPRLFAPTPRSFDVAALHAARALTAPRRAVAPSRYAVGHLTTDEPVVGVDLDELRRFLAQPAQYFLRERANLTLGDNDPPAEEIPLELGPLQRWAIGDRILSRVRGGHSPAAAQHAEWLRGDLPPGELGRRTLDSVTADAVRVASDAAAFDEAPASFHSVDLGIDGVRVSGRGVTRGDLVVATHFSRPNARHLSAAWVDVLTLTVTLQRPVDAVVIGHKRRLRLQAPDPDRARLLLGDLVALAVEGRDRVWPLPPRVSKLWAENRARNADPQADRSLNRTWEWDRDDTWRAVLSPGAKPWDEPAEGSPWARRGERTLLGSLADVIWRPIVGAER